MVVCRCLDVFDVCMYTSWMELSQGIKASLRLRNLYHAYVPIHLEISRYEPLKRYDVRLEKKFLLQNEIDLEKSILQARFDIRHESKNKPSLKKIKRNYKAEKERQIAEILKKSAEHEKTINMLSGKMHDMHDEIKSLRQENDKLKKHLPKSDDSDDEPDEVMTLEEVHRIFGMTDAELLSCLTLEEKH